jgi:hypothetical protein
VLVHDVVADYSERSLTSALPPIGDPESVVRDVLDRVAPFGPRQRYLDAPEIEEIWVTRLEGAGEIPLRRLVKEALRMRPLRIVVGEMRQEESLDLLIALESGLPELS